MKYFLFFLSFALFSCSEPHLPEYSALDTLRVLSLLSDRSSSGDAEYSPSDVVTITPLISDIPATSGLSCEAHACLDPGVNYGAEPTCVGSASDVSIACSVATPTVATSFTGLATSFNVTIPATNIIFANRTVQDQFNGVGYLVTYTLSDGVRRSVAAFKRLVISTRTPKNKNPVLNNSILMNGSNMTTLPTDGGIYNLGISVGAIGTEAYQVMNADGSLTTRNETLITTWFVSDGSFKLIRTENINTTEYTAPLAYPSGRKAYVIALTRDERGGTAAVIKSFP